MKFDLLTTVEYGGCSAKLPAVELNAALKDLPKQKSDNLIVDIDTHDDAGVYKINDELAIIQTTDFFPPVCSDPYEFGEIAAANAISDVYAMGGEVLTAMNLLMFPSDKPMEALKEILRGGQEKVNEAGGVLVGGHTITDDVPKYGLAVMGKVHPDKVITNANAKPGDILILTKPIGSGAVMAGKRIDEINDKDYQTVLDSMKQLNKSAAEIMQKHNVKSATDITGFGLIGHALKMAQGSDVTINLNSKEIPYFNGAYELVEMGCIPGASFRNQEFAEEFCAFSDNVSYEHKMLLFDAQTSGGILMCVSEDKADDIINELKQSGCNNSKVIGNITTKEQKHICIY